MEEREIFLNVAISEKDISKVWKVFLEEAVGSDLKQKASAAYLDLCETPVAIWALYSNSGVDEETKEKAWEMLEVFEEKRRESLRIIQDKMAC